MMSTSCTLVTYWRYVNNTGHFRPIVWPMDKIFIRLIYCRIGDNMNNPLIHEKKEPLCYGYLINDKIGFKVEFDFAGKLCIENPVGQNLVDFAWIDAELIQFLFKTTASVYFSLCKESEKYDYLADGMIGFLDKKYMWINCYLTMYLFGFVEFLLECRADLRLLSNVAVDSFIEEGYSIVQIGDELYPHKDGSIIDVFVQSITERQALVEKTLSKVLGDSNKVHQDALFRFYDYEGNDVLFREHWHSRFETSFGIRSDNLPGVVQLSALARIDDMLRYELVQMLVRDVQYKCCQSCGKLFIPSGRSDSLYCGRIMSGQEKPCNQIGANLMAKKKIEENPALRLYRQAYQRLNKRVEFGYMTPEAFDEWKAQAKPKSEQCLCGELSLDDFRLWIDETSRQR